MQSNLFSLLILVIPVILIFLYIKKKKKGSNSEGVFKKRRDGDEVWNTIKKYLKSKNEFGKEIVESYVAKRPNITSIDKSLPKEQQIKIKNELKELERLEKEENKRIKKSGKKIKQKKEKELYVVLFVTRNPKNFKEDKPRAIECEVINIKINRKESERKINVLRDVSYETESKWILPIKQAEEERLKKEQSKKKTNKKIIKNKDKTKKSKGDEKWAKKEEIVKTKK